MAVYLRCPSQDNSFKPTLFIDRDGVMIHDRHYLASADDVSLISGVCEGLLQARESGFLLIGVSNQSGIGRGYFSVADFHLVMARMDELLADGGVALDGFYYCPHGPEDLCNCRKPLPGLLEEVRDDIQWDPQRSWVIGDKISDISLGRDQGLGAVLVATGHGAEEETKVKKAFPNDSRVGYTLDLKSAVAHILNGPTGEAVR